MTDTETFPAGTLLLWDTLLDMCAGELGTEDEDEAEVLLAAMNGPDGLRYTVAVA